MSCFSGRSAGANRGVLEQLLIEPERHRPCVEPDRQYARDVGVGLFHRHTRLESRDPSKAEVAEEQAGSIEPLRQDHVGVRIEKSETVRHDTNHRTRLRVDGDRPAEHVAIPAESPLPISVREEHGLLRARCIVLAREPPPKRGRHTDGVEHTLRHEQASHLLRLGKPRHGDAASRPDSDVLKDTSFVPIGEVHRRRDVDFAVLESHSRRRMPHPDQFLRLRIRQRFDQDAIDDAEDRGVGADADGQGQQGGRREHRGPREPSQERMESWHVAL